MGNIAVTVVQRSVGMVKNNLHAIFRKLEVPSRSWARRADAVNGKRTADYADFANEGPLAFGVGDRRLSEEWRRLKFSRHRLTLQRARILSFDKATACDWRFGPR